SAARMYTMWISNLRQSCVVLLCFSLSLTSTFFFFNAPATTQIYTLSLHDALPIYSTKTVPVPPERNTLGEKLLPCKAGFELFTRSEEHTSELQSLRHLVCRLLLEKKKKKHPNLHNT